MNLTHNWRYSGYEDDVDMFQCSHCKLVAHKYELCTFEESLMFDGILQLCLGRLMEVAKVGEVKVYEHNH